MATFIEKMTALADELLASDMLTSAVISRDTVSAFDPVTGSVTDSSSAIECRAVAAPVMITLENGAKKETTRVTCDSALLSGDKITIGTIDFTIDEVTTVAPHGTALLWKATVK